MADAPTLTRFAHYIGTVHIRREGWPHVKPEAEALDGKTLHVTAGVEIEGGCTLARRRSGTDEEDADIA